MSKKQIRQFLYTVIALVVCVAGYFIVDTYSQNKKKEAEEESSKIAEENKSVVYEMESVDDVTGFSYVVDGETITLLKDTDGEWKSDNDSSLKIDQSVVESSMLTNLLYVASEEKIEAPDDISQYGFDNPQNQIVIMKLDGSSSVFTIGAQNVFDTSKYYLMLEGDDNVYVVDSVIPNAFSKTLADLEEEETTVEETMAAETEETLETETDN